jgi:DNA-binding NtrC family response regulator
MNPAILASETNSPIGPVSEDEKPSGQFFQIDTAGDGVPPPLEVVEQAYVRRVLEHTGGKRMAAAQLLGISYPTFLKRLRELDLDKPESGVHAAAGAPASSRAR